MIKRPVTIEALLTWAYATERVHEVADRPDDDDDWRQAPRLTSTAAVAGVLAMGTMIDSSRYVPTAGRGDEMVGYDAMAVDALVGKLDRTLAGVVRWCALMGTRPEAYVGVAQRPLPRRIGDKMIVVYADAASRKPLYCPLDYEPSNAEIDTARAVYERWWSALAGLVQDLPDVLRDHRITGFSAPREPWA